MIGNPKAGRFRVMLGLFIIIIIIIILVAVPWAEAGTFRDDFEDGDLEGWRQEDPQALRPTLWKVVDGELECTWENGISTLLLTGDETWKDYTIEFDVNLLEDFGPGDVDIISRYKSLLHLIWTQVGDYYGSDEVLIIRFFDQPLAVRKPFGPLELDIWHHFKLEAIGNRFEFWVNGEKIIEYEEALGQKFRGGAVGLGLANYAARFDNVEITGPDVPDVTPPTWGARPVQPSDKLSTTWGAIKQVRQ